jgi:hypothetical protein
MVLSGLRAWTLPFAESQFAKSYFWQMNIHSEKSGLAQCTNNTASMFERFLIMQCNLTSLEPPHSIPKSRNNNDLQMIL